MGLISGLFLKIKEDILLGSNRKNMKDLLWIGIVVLLGCGPVNDIDFPTGPREEDQKKFEGFYFGADLSYVNEMEDCGARYLDRDGQEKDPFSIFQNEGANLARFRLWHSPDWTAYSTKSDVKKSIRRAKDAGMKVLLDFHYSDTWADPDKQEIPAAWEAHLNDTDKLVELMYDYTFETLKELHNEGLLPEIVQVGNEINGMMLQKGSLVWPIDWNRNARLINSGIRAVRDLAKELNKEIEIMLHIAQPENALWWFQQASRNGVLDYDWIGLSYYPLWSAYDLEAVSDPLKTLVNTYRKNLMIVETAYPFTFENVDQANNILGQDALVTGIPASPAGQKQYLNRLTEIVAEAGGAGVVYWEPAWVSTSCATLWGIGSHWDNATLFDHDHKATEAITWYNASK